MALYLLDYGAGNVKSLANSLKKLGHEFMWIEKPEDFAKAEVSLIISNHHSRPTIPFFKPYSPSYKP